MSKLKEAVADSTLYFMDSFLQGKSNINSCIKVVYLSGMSFGYTNRDETYLENSKFSDAEEIITYGKLMIFDMFAGKISIAEVVENIFRASAQLRIDQIAKN
jgi:hypothetical protein